MKVKYDAYEINSKCWAISNYFDKDAKDTHHYAIFPVIITGFSVDYNNKTNEVDCIYYVKTPEGKEWGDSVESEFVSDSFDELVAKLKIVWENNANWE